MSAHDLPRVLRGPAAISVDTRARTIAVAGRPVTHTRLAFEILAVLLQRRGEVVTHDELAALAWGYEATDHHGAIQTGIYRLRLALDSAGALDVIRAVRGVGYVIDGPPAEAPPLLLSPSTLEAALRAAPYATLLVDPGGAIVLANDATAALTGLEVVALERMPSWLGVIAPESWSIVQVSFGTAATGTVPATTPAFAVSSGAREKRPIRLHTAPIAHHDEVTGILVTLMQAVEAPQG